MLDSQVPSLATMELLPAMTIGVMGAAGGELSDEAIEKSFVLGQAIARQGCILINGACSGLPHHAAQGAKEAGGMTVGISPALSREDHVTSYASPLDHLDVVIYTGAGLMGREVTNIRSSDAVIIVGGRSGTLGEFAIAYDEGKVIGVLEGTGGITPALHELVQVVHKDSGGHLIYDEDPARLVNRVISYYATHHKSRRHRRAD